jgi:hypothetical protein
MDTNPTESPVPESLDAAAHSATPKRGMSPRATFAVLAIAILFVLMPFFFWRASWFGGPMSDEEITRSLAGDAEPRKTQHALAQISARMDRRDAAARRWYPAVVAEARNPDIQIRLTAAWVMGRDNTAPEFHQALLALLADPETMVRANAALSLVRFGDASGRPQLLSLLQPFTIYVGSAGGSLRTRLKEQDAVRPGTLLGRVETSQGVVELRSPVPGKLERWLQATGAQVAPQQPLCLLSPDPQAAWEALRGLYLVGQAEDVPIVESFLRTTSPLPPAVKEQARLTLQAIRSRAEQK